MKFFWGTILFVAIAVVFGSAQAPDTDRLETNEPDSPLVILKMPKAEHPEYESGSTCFQGSVILRVEFRFDGTIGTISLISERPKAAVEKAVETARRIRFLPKVEDGYYITSSRTVSFIFNAD